MNRLEYLKSILMGGKPDATYKWHEWATVHQPLLSPSILSMSGRRMNHFCLGSDPEFALLEVEEGRRIFALDAGMKVGLAAGADQNERLVELRPWPSTSAVEHVAGILCALRWMVRVYPNARRSRWRAGAFYDGDGLGGHVHFGRKRPTRKEEVAALDGLAHVLKFTGLFPVREWAYRMKGDARGQVYGGPGDFRVQAHGYEYRSLPSWLQSPAVAFIAVASSKLAILDPEIMAYQVNKKGLSATQARAIVRGLAKLYKSQDDDAYILYHLLTNRSDEVFLVDHAGDFAARWGIDRARVLVPDNERNYILPSCIQPHESEVQEMLEHLLLSHPLGFKALPPNFKFEIPNGYVWMPTNWRPERRSGFGDLLHNLVISNQFPISIEHTNGSLFRVSGNFIKAMLPGEVELLRAYNHSVDFQQRTDYNLHLVINREQTQGTTIAGLRAILFHSGIFPIWTVDTVEPNSFEKWQAAHSLLPGTKSLWKEL